MLNMVKNTKTLNMTLVQTKEKDLLNSWDCIKIGIQQWASITDQSNVAQSKCLFFFISYLINNSSTQRKKVCQRQYLQSLVMLERAVLSYSSLHVDIWSWRFSPVLSREPLSSACLEYEYISLSCFYQQWGPLDLKALDFYVSHTFQLPKGDDASTALQ